MSTNIDERVVKMSFDDTGFEAGANKAIGILDNLKKALNFNSASDGIASAQKSINSLSMDSISNSVEECSRHFGAFEAFVFGVFNRLGSKAADIGETIVKRLTVQGAMDGFEEYELQMRSIQTILSNTGDKLKAAGLETQEEQIAYINEQLDELNRYADKTIYNFSQMTRNIGLFTAAGVDLDVATKSIQGISNLAAASGADNAAAGRAMYNLSQAISTGTVRLMDWNSVVNAGMGGELFQEALKRTARVHGIAVDEIIAKQGSFRESLSEGWLTADVLTETLEQLTIEYDEVGDAAYNAAYENLRNSGYSHEAAVSILDLAKNASEAATKVRTWTQLWDTVGESIGSGWAQTWRTIVGDFLEATELFTWFSDKITGVVNASNDARNAILQQWADAGGRVALVDTFKNIYEVIEKPLSAIAKAFSNVFGITAEQLWNITTAIAVFTKSLILSDDAVELLTMVFTDVFTVIHSVLGVFGNLIRIFVSFGKVAWEVIRPISELGFLLFGFFADGVARFSESVLSVMDTIEEKIGVFRDAVTTTIRSFLDGRMTLSAALSQIGRIVSNVFGGMISTAVQDLSIYRDQFWEKAKAIAGYIFDGLKNGISEFLPSLWEWAKSIGETILNAVKDFLGIQSPSKKFYEVGKNVILGLTSGVSDFIDKVADIAQSIASVILNIVSDAVSGIKQSVGNIASKIFAKLPAPVQKALRAIKNFATSFAKQAKLLVTGSKFFQTLTNEMKKIQNGEVPNALNILKSLGATIFDVFGGIRDFVSRTKIGPLFESITESIKNFASSIGITMPSLSGVGEAFGGLVDSVESSDAFVSFTDFLSNVPDTFKSLFDQIGTVFKTGGDRLSKEAGQLNIENAAENAGLIADEFVRIPETIENAVDTLKTAVSDFLSGFSLDKLEEYNSTIHNVLDIGLAATFINFISSLTKVNKTLSGAGQTIIGWPKELGNALARFGEGFNAWKKETKAEAVMKIAIAIAILAGSLFLIASIPADDLARAGDAMAKMSAAILGVLAALAFMDSKLTLFSTASMQNAGNAIKGLGIGVLAFAAALWVLSKVPADTMGPNMLTLVEIAGVLAALAKVISADGKSIKSGAIGMIFMAAAVYAMAKAIEAIGGIDPNLVDQGMAPFIAIMLMLTLFGKFGGQGIGELLASFLKFGAGLMLVAVSFVVLGTALELVSTSLKTIDNLPVVLGVLGGALAAFVIVCMVLKDVDALSIATALVMFSSSLLIMTVALAGLSYVADKFGQSFGFAVGTLVALISTFGILSFVLPPEQVKATAISLVLFGAALAIMAAALGGLTYVVSQGGDNFRVAVVAISALIAVFGLFAGILGGQSAGVTATAVSLVIFAAAIGVMAGAFMLLNKVKLKDIAPQLIAIIAAFALFAVGAAALSSVSIAMVYVGASMLIFSAAVLVLAGAFWILVQALQDLSAINPVTIITRLQAMGIGLAGMVIGFVKTIFTSIGAAITEHLPEIIEFGKQIIDGLMQGIQSAIGWVTENVDLIISKIGEGINAAMEWIRENGGVILNGIIEGISAGWGWLQENGGTIVEMIGNGIVAAKENILPKVTEFINGVKEKLGSEEFRNEVLETGKRVGKALLDGIGMIGSGIGEIVTNLFSGLTGGISDKIGEITTAASEIATNFITSVKNFFGIESPSTVMQEIGGFIVQGLINGLNVLGGLSEAAGNLLTTVTDGVKNLPGNLLDLGRNALSNLSSAFSSGKSDIGGKVKGVVDGAAENAKGLGSKLKTTASTAMTTFGTAIKSGISGAKTHFSNLVSAASAAVAPMKNKLKSEASQAMTAFANAIKAGTSASKAAVNSLMNATSGAVRSIYSKFYNSGRDSVRGLIEGIDSLLPAAKRKAQELMDTAVKAANARARIKSPSRVFMQMGGYMVEGLIIGIGNLMGDAADASANLSGTVIDSFGSSLNGMAVSMDDLLDTDYNPVITPVINSAEFDSNLQQLSALMNSRLANSIDIGNVNYNETFAGKLDAVADINKQAMQQFAENAIDYDLLGVSVANALIRSGVHVEMDGGQLMGYLAGEIKDVRRMYG